MPGFGHLGRPGKPVAIAAGLVILLIVAWLAFAQLSAKFSDRSESFYPTLAEAAKDGAITRAGFQMNFSPGVRVSSTKFTFFPLPPNGALSSLLPPTHKAFAQT